MELRTRPKSNYLQSAEWEELHVLTTHWQSDMAFFEDELRFIDVLFDKYFNSLIDPENMDKTKAIATNLSHVKSSRESLSSRIAGHLRHIKELMTNTLTQDEAMFRQEHGRLEDDLTEFVKSFRKVKQEIFQLTESIARTEKAKHLISK
jgi:paraquat-inducible protein B